MMTQPLRSGSLRLQSTDDDGPRPRHTDLDLCDLSWGGALLYLTPGPDMLFTIASGMRGGAGPGVAAAAGISLGSFCHTLIAAAGLAVLLLAYPFAMI